MEDKKNYQIFKKENNKSNKKNKKVYKTHLNKHLKKGKYFGISPSHQSNCIMNFHHFDKVFLSTDT